VLGSPQHENVAPQFLPHRPRRHRL
jgi:hypothetical protein